MVGNYIELKEKQQLDDVKKHLGTASEIQSRFSGLYEEVMSDGNKELLDKSFSNETYDDDLNKLSDLQSKYNEFKQFATSCNTRIELIQCNLRCIHLRRSYTEDVYSGQTANNDATKVSIDNINKISSAMQMKIKNLENEEILKKISSAKEKMMNEREEFQKVKKQIDELKKLSEKVTSLKEKNNEFVNKAKKFEGCLDSLAYDANEKNSLQELCGKAKSLDELKNEYEYNFSQYEKYRKLIDNIREQFYFLADKIFSYEKGKAKNFSAFADVFHETFKSMSNIFSSVNSAHLALTESKKRFCENVLTKSSYIEWLIANKGKKQYNNVSNYRHDIKSHLTKFCQMSHDINFIYTDLRAVIIESIHKRDDLSKLNEIKKAKCKYDEINKFIKECSEEMKTIDEKLKLIHFRSEYESDGSPKEGRFENDTRCCIDEINTVCENLRQMIHEFEKEHGGEYSVIVNLLIEKEGRKLQVETNEIKSEKNSVCL